MDVSVQREADGRFLVKLAADHREVDVRLSAADIRTLVGSAHWSERGIVRAGESAGAPVFWASDGEQAMLLIGHDDETRKSAITVPFRVVDEIVRRTILSAGDAAFTGDATLTQAYEPPSPDDDLVRKLRAAVASVPDLREAYLVARRTAWSGQERLELGVIGHIGDDSRARRALRPLERNAPRSLEAVRVALAPFSPPNESAPLAWCAYSTTPVPDEARDAGIRLA